MKILFVTPYYKPYFGGIERVIEKLSIEFKKNPDTEVAVLTSKWSFPRVYHSDWQNADSIDGERILRLNSWPSKAPSFFQVPLVWFSPWEIRKIVLEYKPDVIQLMNDRWFWVNFWVLVWAKLAKIPVFFSLSFHKLSLLQKFLIPFNFLITRWVNSVQVITNLEKSLVNDAYYTPLENITVIPWGVDAHSEVRKEAIDGQVKILAVGRISKHKGQEWLAQVYAETEFNQPTELVLVGAIEEPGVAEKINKISLSQGKKITITGEVDEATLNNSYVNAHVFALFPEYEAFGLVFLEAMSYGLPVVTHSVGALKEVLGPSAIIVPAYDKTEAAKQLKQLVESSSLRANLDHMARKFIQTNYSWQKTASEFLALYNSNLS